MKHNFQLAYNPDIYEDIQKIVSHYRIETGSHNLGKRFVKTVKEELKKLQSSALQYQIRYDDIREIAFNFSEYITEPLLVFSPTIR